MATQTEILTRDVAPRLSHRPQPDDRRSAAPCKVLLCHNYYQQQGGEGRVFADETWLLEAHGHQIERYTLHNDAIKEMGRWETARKTLFNRKSYNEIRSLIRRTRPDVMHCTNIFPLISPAAYYAARAEGVAVVQSLHNFRLLCSNALFLRDNRICEKCLGKTFGWPGIVHACYRGSRSASAAVAGMVAMHRIAGTWSRAVDRYIAMSRFSREKLIEGGLPAGKITVKPNFVHPDPGPGSGSGGYAIFVGRLSNEKGIDTLLEAWRLLGERLPLKIVGGGPLADQVASAAADCPNIDYLGPLQHSEVLTRIGEAALLVMPSITYENCPKTLLESYAKGTPVVASGMGAMAEMVDHGRTGLLFEPGKADDLVATLQPLLAAPATLTRMRQSAREEYQQRYTAEVNYTQLMNIYRQAGGEDSKKDGVNIRNMGNNREEAGS